MEAPTKQQQTGQANALNAYKEAHGGKKPPQTQGEKLFNILDYFGIGWVANASLSVLAADQINHSHLKNLGDYLKSALGKTLAPAPAESKVTQEQMDKANQLYAELKSLFPTEHQASLDDGTHIPGFFKRLGTPSQSTLDGLKERGVLKEAIAEEFEFLKKSKLAANKANFWVSFGALNIGGWLVMIPMKLLEDRKEKIVHTLDDQIYGKHAPEAVTQRVEARHEQIKQDPHQTWSSELLSRAIGTPMIFGLYGQTAFKENALKKVGVKFEGMQHYEELLGNKAYIYAKEEAPELYKKFENYLEGAPKRLGAIEASENEGSIGAQRFKKGVGFTFVDFTYSLMMASIVFTWTRVLGPLIGIKKQGEAEQESPNQPSPTPHKSSTVPVMAAVAAPLAATASHAIRTTVVNGMAIDVPTTKVDFIKRENTLGDFHQKEHAQDSGQASQAYSSHAERTLASQLEHSEAVR